MCEVLRVSRSGYYDWCRRQGTESGRESANRVLLGQIREVFGASDQTYVSLRVWRQLQKNGVCCGENRVARLMQKSGLRTAVPERAWPRTTVPDPRLPTFENVLERDFAAEAPDRKWAFGITYIPTDEGWLYLSVVLDLSSRHVVVWAMKPPLGRALATDALEMALRQRSPDEGLIHHSDRGCQYASEDQQVLLEERCVIGSMSRRGNCLDNAPVESFFGTLKTERVRRRRYQTRSEAKRDLFRYIEVWVSRARIGSDVVLFFERMPTGRHDRPTGLSEDGMGHSRGKSVPGRGRRAQQQGLSSFPWRWSDTAIPR
ncbi:transposase InsO family protein [Salinibacter ruber]|nr:transposase InsO family protein [Salinibacter ruber]